MEEFAKFSRRSLVKRAVLSVGIPALSMFRGSLALAQIKGPEITAMNDQNAFTVAPDKDRRDHPIVLRGNDSLLNKVSGSDTEGRATLFEQVVSPGTGPVLHLHHNQNEWWYVLDGEFLFQLGEKKVRVEPHTSVFGPRGVPHAFRCVGKTPGKMLLVFDPAGQIEEFFVALAKIGINAGAGEHNEKDLLQRFGMEYVGPPLSGA
jgi:mannose-6-phosphate isomerase-like protein (cupin superfamily)